MKKIEEKQNRKELIEGRNYGIGFSILNKIDNNRYETYLPFTACRDYLNDFSFVESFKKEIGSIHGYNHKFLNCFFRKRYFYLGVNILHYSAKSKWKKYDEAQEQLLSNYNELLKFINSFENSLNLKKRSTVELDEDTLIFRVPIYWIKKAPAISLYTLIIRCYFNLDKFENLELHLKNHKSFIEDDNYMINNVKEFYNKINIKKKFKFKYKYKNKGYIHNYGIQNYLK